MAYWAWIIMAVLRARYPSTRDASLISPADPYQCGDVMRWGPYRKDLIRAPLFIFPFAIVVGGAPIERSVFLRSEVRLQSLLMRSPWELINLLASAASITICRSVRHTHTHTLPPFPLATQRGRRSPLPKGASAKPLPLILYSVL